MCDFFTKEEREVRDAYYKESRPPTDRDILKALFDTIPTVFAKEDRYRWTGITEKSLKRSDNHE